MRGLSPALSSPADSLASVLRRAGDWFLDSGIQDPDGGVARYYLVAEGRNKRTSTEITGYALSALCYLYGRTGEVRYREGAERAAGLLRRAWDGARGVFPFEVPVSENLEENRAYFFDSGIIIRGLLRLERVVPDGALRELAVRCGHGMMAAFAHGGGMAPILQLPSGAPLAYGTSWSDNPGCYQLKSALAWRQLSLVAAEPAFDRAFAAALDRAMANDAGFLPGTADRLRVMDRLHAYCYYLEALLAVGDRAECRERLRAGIGRVAGYLRDLAPEFARSDVYAQLLRVRLLAAARELAPLDAVAAAEEAAAIPGFQYSGEGRRLDGGFCFGRRGGVLMPYANPVSTAFCLQALAWWHDYRWDGGLRDTWQELI